ncbi:DUF2624 domain-containing protein [Oceanobacillus manasiensis]|uniref:DUF2624 domain-containing protein n=1 Tax=Oceanobacillus manasiensis TaxID=586413 RepID=UPI0005A946C5|nr:DUF2624 domain-containing protein [Oceanobacillus manasiensis]
MSFFIKQMITSKLKQLSQEDLLKHAKQYGFTITNEEANSIANYLKTHDVDPFTERGRNLMLQELAKRTDISTARKAHKLFKELITSYGMEHLFE